MLRAAELGISVQDFDLLTVGMLLDIFTERANDAADADELTAEQSDFDNF